MPTAYIDANRGNDTTGDGSIAKPFKSLAKAANWNGSGAGGILLARDSIFDVAITTTNNGQIPLTSAFNGASGARCTIGAYDPPGAGSLTTKPVIRRRMFPTPADWLWDGTINCGQPRGWYIQFSFAAAFWDARVKVAGQYAETMNQDTTSNTGLGWINGGQNGNHPGEFVNGMNLDTLRFNFDYGGGNVAGATGARLYLSGAGLRTPGAGNDPSSVVGPNQIEIAFGWVFSMYDAGSYCLIENLRIESGSGLLLFQGSPDTVKGGLELRNCEGYDTSNPIRINNGTGTQSASYWPFDVRDNSWKVLTGPSFTVYGAGVVGTYRNNEFEDGNIASSMGGGVYMQCKPSTYNGATTPFVVQNNVARRWKNGAGNNEFDGGCYYVDVNDSGTVLIGNRAYDSFVAFQCGSGQRSEWYSNIAVNCEQFAMMNNPNSAGWKSNDYHFCNNLFVAAKRGTFEHGDTATVHKYHAPIYHVGASSDLVSLRFRNNVMINHPENAYEIPLCLGTAQNWTDGKVSADKNLFIGYGPRLVDADFGSTNKTASATNLPADTVCGFRNSSAGDFRLDASSQLIRAGAETGSRQIVDASGTSFCSPPSVGPYEVARLLKLFGRSVQI